MIYLQKRRDLQPLQLILRGILLQNDTNSMTNAAGGGGQGFRHESVSKTLQDRAVGVDAAVAEERPHAAVFLHCLQIAVGINDLSPVQ